KWGAAGLMVCIGGEPINVGGCGINDVIGVNRKSAEGTETIDIEQQFCDTTSAEEYCNKMVFFVDDGDHQFGSGDTIYEVTGEKDCSCTDVPGATECWIDVDGDGYSPFTGDCDETCSTCYVGSTATTASPDGRDQNCNGIVDDGAISTCSGAFRQFGYNDSCNWVDHGIYRFTKMGVGGPCGSLPGDPCGCENASSEGAFLEKGIEMDGVTKECNGVTYSAGNKLAGNPNVSLWHFGCKTRVVSGGYR
ncbi:MAG: hypothetical protein KAS87_00945, partial [Candidatus Omnitrophica bacterium]|nr:hypothetical protein [Candidatus Omnitrophota bacterium]